MNTVINPKYVQVEDFVRSIPAIFQEQGKTIYKSRNEIKVFEVNGVQINVKQYRVPSFFNRVIYTLFRPAKVLRAYQYAEDLISQGFDTPAPIAYILFKRGGLITQSYFISMQSLYTRNMYEFGEGPLKGREDIVVAFAQYTARLHNAGIYHCDYSPGNILFDEIDGEIRFCLVDINRMQFGPVCMAKGCANFARLWGKRELFTLLAKTYADARGFDVSESTHLILSKRDQFWKRYARKYPITFEMD